MGVAKGAHDLFQAIPTQEHLEKALRVIFDGVDILNNARKSGLVRNPETGGYLEIDFSIPEYNLGFEFQDSHHYITTWYYQVHLDYVTHRDTLKHELLRSQGGTLIQVPCWWDGDVKSLIAEINFQRPDLDLLSQPSQLIALNPPLQFFNTKNVEGTMGLMLASFPKKDFSINMLPANLWWMGEKFDGVRACWDPERKVLCSRSSIALILPIPLHNLFISLRNYLDSEIWFGRGFYPDTQLLVSSPTEVVTWPFLRVIGFDDPSPASRALPFEKRYAAMLSYIQLTQFTVIPAPRVLSNPAHLKMAIRKILENGGEGVILQKRASVYDVGRSPSLLKLKASRVDLEALVIKASPKSFTLKLSNGTILKVPRRNAAPSAQRAIAGDVVTIAHERFSRYATPVDPQITRIRSDVTWEHVIMSRFSDATLNPQSKAAVRSQQRPIVLTPRKNPRLILERFANRKGFDPLIASNWFNSFGKLRRFANQLGTTAISLLSKCFPNMKSDLSKFTRRPRKIWSTSTRREFLNSFARQRGLDPLIPETWYSLYQETARLPNFYDRNGGSAKEQLFHVYPDIGLEVSLFESYLKENKDAKKLTGFLEYAKAKGFDPLVPENWYSESYESFLAFEGTKKAITEYGGSQQAALLDLFPNIGLERTKFSRASRTYWEDMNNRRTFFDELAMKKGLDPLIPETWYQISLVNISKTVEGIRPILAQYNSSFVNALRDTYPDIGIDPEKFPRRQQNYWSSAENRRKFFVEFAKQNNFDPLLPENWYSVPKQKLKGLKKIESIIRHHQRRIDNTLIELFPEIGLDINAFSSRGRSRKHGAG
eukprot:Phypoly_transcript_02939.p1 GENE.Phypoly_transcript_02939~~Phypoly_transcript_02939.p1  ORF type:complete len:825 (+),score=95.05 Phypoly_transcript_02939:89-2563(+)